MEAKFLTLTLTLTLVKTARSDANREFFWCDGDRELQL
jgi:hypothetical protein